MFQQFIKGLFFCCTLGLIQTVKANVSLPAVLSDNMVLQQNAEVSFWGWAKPGEEITITTGWNTVQKAQASNQGTWSMVVKTPVGSLTPYVISIKGYNEVVLKNVLVGEVWICSGQSNMEWSANSPITNKDEEIKQANFPNIRFFSVEHRTALTPQVDLAGNWVECTPSSMQNFSAIGYFFARKIQSSLNVPIGVINSSWGGTPAESWMPAEAFAGSGLITEAAQKLTPVPWGPVEIARIYNAMIEPLTHFKIAGALWYQGESNVGTAYAYKATMTALISSWRKKWGNDFSFYYCQIAPYRYGKPMEGAELRDAQRRTLDVPKTGMVVTSDIGDTSDIHPRNKLDVGLRLANLALNQHYKTNQDVVSGPLYKESRIEGNHITVVFDNAIGLNFKGPKLTHFEIAGDDGIYFPADAKINPDNTIEVKAEQVKKPASLRFAWSNTATPNLFNGAGLPASCFKSN